MKYILLLLFFNTIVFGATTTVQPNVILYSKYYPNQTTIFKGNIVFINGSGVSMGEWIGNRQFHSEQFFQCARKIGSLFFYNRGGFKGSPPNYHLSKNNPITAELISQQLQILLKKQKIKPPYIIVAHSYFATAAGYFVLTHEKEVKALLLIDPVPRYFNFNARSTRRIESGMEAAKKYPATYIYAHYKSGDVESFYLRLGFIKTKNELKKLGEINNNIPVIIFSSTQMEEDPNAKLIDGDWFEQQKQWLNQNPNSNIIQVRSSHIIQENHPKMICNEIRKLVTS